MSPQNSSLLQVEVDSPTKAGVRVFHATILIALPRTNSHMTTDPLAWNRGLSPQYFLLNGSYGIPAPKGIGYPVIGLGVLLPDPIYPKKILVSPG